MKEHWQSLSYDDDSILSNISPNSNPFTFIANAITGRYFVPLSNTAMALLIIFLIFHIFIALFCLILLLLPYFRGASKSQWLFRTLNIQDKSGTTVYKTPLLWVNAGILMATSQLVGSVGAQAFILIQIKSAMSPEYSLHAQLEPSMGVMYLGEMLTYWSLMHCFLVAMWVDESSKRRIYYDNGTQGDTATGAWRWAPSPMILNMIFFGFPACVAAVTIGFFTWLGSAHMRLLTRAQVILDHLNEGSIIWDQLTGLSASPLEKLDAMQKLLDITMMQSKNLADDSKNDLAQVIHIFRILHHVLLVLLCITFLSFLLIFGVLVKKYQNRKLRQLGSQFSKPSLSFESILNEIRSLVDIAREDRQFLQMLIRSLAMIIAMMTMMALHIFSLARAADVIQDRRCRGIAAWLATAVGVWSAIPITWHCWGLRSHDLSRATETSTNSQKQVAPASEVKVTQNISINSLAWDSDTAEIHIKVISQPQNTTWPM